MVDAKSKDQEAREQAKQAGVWRLTEVEGTAQHGGTEARREDEWVELADALAAADWLHDVIGGQNGIKGALMGPALERIATVANGLTTAGKEQARLEALWKDYEKRAAANAQLARVTMEENRRLLEDVERLGARLKAMTDERDAARGGGKAWEDEYTRAHALADERRVVIEEMEGKHAQVVEDLQRRIAHLEGRVAEAERARDAYGKSVEDLRDEVVREVRRRVEAEHPGPNDLPF